MKIRKFFRARFVLEKMKTFRKLHNLNHDSRMLTETRGEIRKHVSTHTRN